MDEALLTNTDFGVPHAAELIPPEARARLLANAVQSSRLEREGEDANPFPVVKLFTPDGGATWLISEMDPEDEDLLFGLCDLGQGAPELGYVRLSELKALRGRLNLPVERDLYFRPKRSVESYASRARLDGVVDSAR